MQRRALLLSVATVGALAACGETIDRQVVGDAPVDVAVLDENLTALKDTFNTATGKLRLLFIAGPSCGPCLRALMELNEALGPQLLSNERVAVLVVYVPTLGAEERHAGRAAQLMHGASVSHYWDPSGRSGNVVQQALHIPQYAWDVWLTYSPDATWNDALPPPAAWMHQLHGLPIESRLDADAFATDVRERLERLT